MRQIDRRIFLSAIGSVAAASVIGARGRAEEAAMVEEPWSAGGLAGTFSHPATGPARGPAVLILPGSGALDRDGNQPGFVTNTYRMLAAGFAAEGISSLRYDKRGVGASRSLVAREDELRFEQAVADAVEASRAVSQRPDISAIAIVGHSEGGLVALYAAPQASVAGLALLATAGRPLAVILREQFAAAPWPDALRAEGLDILDRIVRGEHVENVPPQWQLHFRPSVQPYLRSELNLDPVVAIAALSVPVLIVQGARDFQVTRADFDALSRARRDAQTLLLPNANHVLKPAPADREGNIKAYTDPVLPLDPALMPALVRFVRSLAH